MEKYDVAALGKLLIDFTQNGISPQGNPLFALVNKIGHENEIFLHEYLSFKQYI